MSKKIDRQALLTAVESCTGLTESQRADLHQLLTETPKYGLVWEDTPEEVYDELKEEIPVMNEDRSKAIVNGNEYPNHVIIEGDNLHALTDLCYTHAGKIDVIYIDPPYNTGNKDFVYNDQFINNDNGFRHSMWLSFMEKRLNIAKELLSEKGALFISIDDNEASQLIMLCNQILGNMDYIAQIPWRKRTAKTDVPHSFSQDYEWILLYAKQDFRAGIKKDSRKYFETPDFPGEPWRVHDMSTQRTAEERPHSNFTIVNPKNGKKYPVNPQAVWRITKEGLPNYLKENRIVFPGDYSFLKIKKPVLRYWKKDDETKAGDLFGYTTVSSFLPPDVGMTQDGTKDITNIFGSKAFGFPKPISLIKYLLKVANPAAKDSTILDFFAGSGTTLHATMELNKEDGGHRQCILVTNNENKICEEVTYPRNKKVIEGYDTPKGEHVEGLHDNNLRYFKMDSVSRIPSMHNRRKLAAHMVDMLRIKHNIYTRKNQIGSYTIDTATMRYYEDNGRRLLIIMMPTEIYGVVEAIQALPPLDEKINVYVYSDGPYAYEDDFTAVADRVNVIALPGPMLKTFHRIAPKMNDVQVVEPDRELTEGEADDTSNDFNDGEE